MHKKLFQAFREISVVLLFIFALTNDSSGMRPQLERVMEYDSKVIKSLGRWLIAERGWNLDELRTLLSVRETAVRKHGFFKDSKVDDNLIASDGKIISLLSTSQFPSYLLPELAPVDKSYMRTTLNSKAGELNRYQFVDGLNIATLQQYLRGGLGYNLVNVNKHSMDLSNRRILRSIFILGSPSISALLSHFDIIQAGLEPRQIAVVGCSSLALTSLVLSQWLIDMSKDRRHALACERDYSTFKID